MSIISGTFMTIMIASGALFAQVGVTTLSPDATFSVNQGTAAGLKIREMRSFPGGLWLLLQSQSGDFSIFRMNTSGVLQSKISLASGEKVAGLAVTSSGVATLTSRDRKPALVQYDPGGRIISEIPLGCAIADSLLSIGGNVGVVCPDGRITRFSGKGQIDSYSSWARPGTLSEVLSENRLALVDQVTGQTLWNDLIAGSVTATTVDSPEIVEARRKNQAAEAALKPAVPQAQPMATQKQLMIMDTGTDSKSVYLLVWPYSIHSGPPVIKLGIDGKIHARYQCTTPGVQAINLHKLEVVDGYLFVGSVSGTIYRYKL